MSAAEVTRKWAEAINRHDPAGFAALYAPNAVVQDPQYPAPLEGRDAIQKDMGDFMVAFPDLHMALSSLVEKNDACAVEGTFRGTHSGPLATPSGDIPPTNRQFVVNGAASYRLDAQGRILEERRYYDLAGLFAQLEVAP